MYFKIVETPKSKTTKEVLLNVDVNHPYKKRDEEFPVLIQAWHNVKGYESDIKIPQSSYKYFKSIEEAKKFVRNFSEEDAYEAFDRFFNSIPNNF